MSKIISYDEVEDTLFIHEGFDSDEKFKGNIDLGKVVFDLSTKGHVRGVEIMDASLFFKSVGLDPEQLKTIEGASIKSSRSHESIIIFLSIKTAKIEARIPIPVSLAMPA